MEISIQLVVVLVIIVAVLIWKGGLKPWHAAIALLAGFAIASWPMIAPIFGAVLTGLAHEIMRRCRGSASGSADPARINKKKCW